VDRIDRRFNSREVSHTPSVPQPTGNPSGARASGRPGGWLKEDSASDGSDYNRAPTREDRAA